MIARVHSKFKDSWKNVFANLTVIIVLDIFKNGIKRGGGLQVEKVNGGSVNRIYR